MRTEYSFHRPPSMLHASREGITALEARAYTRVAPLATIALPRAGSNTHPTYPSRNKDPLAIKRFSLLMVSRTNNEPDVLAVTNRRLRLNHMRLSSRVCDYSPSHEHESSSLCKIEESHGNNKWRSAKICGRLTAGGGIQIFLAKRENLSICRLGVNNNPKRIS